MTNQLITTIYGRTKHTSHLDMLHILHMSQDNICNKSDRITPTKYKPCNIMPFNYHN